MEKLRFTLLIATLLLSFPLWFYAEMKNTDRHVKHIRNTPADSSRVIKSQAAADTTLSTDKEFAAMPFSNEKLVNFNL